MSSCLESSSIMAQRNSKKMIHVSVYLSLCLSSSSSDSLSESSCFFIFFSFCFGVLFFPSGVSFSFFSAFSGVSSTSLFSLLLSFNLSWVFSSSPSFLAGAASRASLLRPWNRNQISLMTPATCFLHNLSKSHQKK